MFLMSVTSLFGAPLASQSAYNNALDTVRGIIYEATNNDKALAAPASESLFAFGDSGSAPNVIGGLCNITGFPLEEIKTRKIETLGQAAQFIIERS